MRCYRERHPSPVCKTPLNFDNKKPGDTQKQRTDGYSEGIFRATLFIPGHEVWIRRSVYLFLRDQEKTAILNCLRVLAYYKMIYSNNKLASDERKPYLGGKVFQRRHHDSKLHRSNRDWLLLSAWQADHSCPHTSRTLEKQKGVINIE